MNRLPKVVFKKKDAFKVHRRIHNFQINEYWIYYRLFFFFPWLCRLSWKMTQLNYFDVTANYSIFNCIVIKRSSVKMNQGQHISVQRENLSVLYKHGQTNREMLYHHIVLTKSLWKHFQKCSSPFSVVSDLRLLNSRTWILLFQILNQVTYFGKSFGIILKQDVYKPVIKFYHNLQNLLIPFLVSPEKPGTVALRCPKGMMEKFCKHSENPICYLFLSPFIISPELVLAVIQLYHIF